MKLTHLALLAVFATAAAQAQAPATGSSVEQACSGELKSLCPGQTGNAAAQCLQKAAKSNANAISSGCKSALQAAGGKRRM